jgi:F-type H+-transporting ATPase subunit alpha
MKDAEHSLRKAVQDVSADVHKWFDTNEELSDKDREIILEIAHKALVIFQHIS